MNKKKLILTILEKGLLILLIFLLLKVGYLVKIDTKECVKSPLTYAAKRFDDSNLEKNVSFSCTCNFGVPNSGTLYFDQHEMKPLEISGTPLRTYEFNISDFEDLFNN